MRAILWALTPSPTPTPSLTATPTPSATVASTAAAASSSGSGDDGWTLLVTVVVAALGVVGLALAAWITARSALRARLIDMSRADAEAGEAFVARATASINDLGISNSRVLDSAQELHERAQAEWDRQRADGIEPDSSDLQIPLPEYVMERNRSATDEWRAVLADALLYGSQSLVGKLMAYDHARSRVVDLANAINTSRDLQIARRALESMRGDEGLQATRELQILKLQGRYQTAHLASVFRIRRYAQEWRAHVHEEIEKAQKAIESADKGGS